MDKKVYCDECRHFNCSYGSESCRKIEWSSGPLIEGNYRHASYRRKLHPSEQNANNVCDKWEPKE